MSADESKSGIWLEVAEVQLDKNEIKVQLKGDREHPKPNWWTVDQRAVEAWEPGKPSPYATYRAILHEMDKKRVALACLSCEPISSRKERTKAANRTEAAGQKAGVALRCIALRFQSADLGSRAS
jgi:hypothetical protein